MPLFYQHNFNNSAKIGVWHIAESESFFLEKVSLPAQHIAHPHKRLQHLAGRFLLHELYPGFPYDLIEIADTRKPFLPNEDYHFSISHCGEYAAVIISKEKRVGVDIEMPSEKILRVQHKFLSEGEARFFENDKYMADAKAKMGDLTLLWSCKEAVFKWYGDGGVDFKKHIRLVIKNLNAQEGRMQCLFKKNNPVELTVYYKRSGNLWLTWVI